MVRSCWTGCKITPIADRIGARPGRRSRAFNRIVTAALPLATSIYVQQFLGLVLLVRTISVVRIAPPVAAHGARKGLAGVMQEAILALVSLLMTLLEDFRAGRLAPLAVAAANGAGGVHVRADRADCTGEESGPVDAVANASPSRTGPHHAGAMGRGAWRNVLDFRRQRRTSAGEEGAPDHVSLATD